MVSLTTFFCVYFLTYSIICSQWRRLLCLSYDVFAYSTSCNLLDVLHVPQSKASAINPIMATKSDETTNFLRPKRMPSINRPDAGYFENSDTGQYHLEDNDHTARMHTLIWVSAGRIIMSF